MHAMLLGTIGFYHFITTFTDIDLGEKGGGGGGGVTSSAQSKTSWLLFLTHFSTHRDENLHCHEAIREGGGGGGGGASSAQSKTSWLLFLTHFSTHRDENLHCHEAIQLEHILILLLN